MDAADGTSERSNRTSSRRKPLVVGLVSALGTVALMLPGAGRTLDQDSGLEVGLFVATNSVWDAFNKLYLLTNQVLFSFLEHLVCSATGSRSEVVLRLLPIAFSAIAVGLLAGLLTERFGVVPGLAGAAILATNPMFALQGSQVRGYSLVVLCAIVTTALFVRALADDRMSTGSRICYAVFGAVGVATHLYMLVVLGVLLAMSVVRRRQFERIALPTLCALLGLAAYIQIAQRMRAVIDASGRSFLPTFPRDLAVELLGGGVLVALLTLAIVAPVAWNARRSRVFQLGVAAVLGATTAIWLMGPSFLYPRFFLWLLPVVAVATAIAVARQPRWLVLVVVIVALQLFTAWPRLTTDVYPNRQAAKVLVAASARGGIPCAVDVFTAQRLVGYTNSFAVPRSAEQAKQCAVVVRIGERSPKLDGEFDRVFPYHRALKAETPGRLWSAKPIACWTATVPPAGCELPNR